MWFIEFIIDIIRQIFEWIKTALSWMYEKFLNMNIFEKGIILTFIPAFFAITLTFAEYQIFGRSRSLGNPIGHYLIGIVIVMYITHHIKHIASMIVRIILNGYYLFWAVYVHFSGDIARVSYSLSIGYYINIVVPFIFIMLSVASFYLGDEY